MNTIFMLLLVVVCGHTSQAQETPIRSTLNLRATFLLVPFTPLLTLETRTAGNLTIQLESNFRDTHGVNLKWYVQQRMQGGYLFTGMALVNHRQLREDQKQTLLPYVGGGFALRFGPQKAWIWDTRLGVGPTLNADRNLVLPVIKSGLGRTF
ncbi:MAG TPA: hypothetical protein DCS93_02235 [Microscillaceae bacterium]|nr:hypothetical protein [Microscillaceae bacterium]